LALLAISVRTAAFANLMVAGIASKLVFQMKIAFAMQRTATNHRVPGVVSLPMNVPF
jgi:hypothetical protein